MDQPQPLCLSDLSSATENPIRRAGHSPITESALVHLLVGLDAILGSDLKQIDTQAGFELRATSRPCGHRTAVCGSRFRRHGQQRRGVLEPSVQ